MAEQIPFQEERRPILVVDDEPYILRSLSYLLEREGFQVETASNGEEALSLLHTIHPSLVFLDIMMPRASGYEVCQKIREDASLAGIYVIFLSARGQRADVERGLSSGADEYITKPFSPRQVAERVNALFESANGRGTAA